MYLYYRAIGIIQDIWYNLRGRCQRFKRGYAYGDVWDMDHWFMRTVRLMLIHLRTYGDSFPMEFEDRDAWCAVLDKMINCLDFMDEDKVYAFLGFVEIKDYQRMTSDDLRQVREIMAENKTLFFELFSKHFYDLWD